MNHRPSALCLTCTVISFCEPKFTSITQFFSVCKLRHCQLINFFLKKKSISKRKTHGIQMALRQWPQRQIYIDLKFWLHKLSIGFENPCTLLSPGCRNLREAGILCVAWVLLQEPRLTLCPEDRESLGTPDWLVFQLFVFQLSLDPGIADLLNGDFHFFWRSGILRSAKVSLSDH